jgi:tetratricopeptide (TPR) repeat protein
MTARKISFLILFILLAATVYSQTAEEYYKQAADLDYSKKENLRKALLLLNKAIELSPEYAEALDLRAEIYDKQASYKEEIADLSMLIKNDSTNAEYFKKRAAAYVLKNEPDKAISDYSYAFSLDTSMIDCILERGKIYGEVYLDKKAQKAIADFTYCINHGSVTIKSQAYVGRGRVYENLEKFDKAMADYNAATAANPLNRDAYLYRGILKISLNQDGCHDLLKYRDMSGPGAQDYLNKYCAK